MKIVAVSRNLSPSREICHWVKSSPSGEIRLFISEIRCYWFISSVKLSPRCLRSHPNCRHCIVEIGDVYFWVWHKRHYIMTIVILCSTGQLWATILKWCGMLLMSSIIGLHCSQQGVLTKSQHIYLWMTSLSWPVHMYCCCKVIMWLTKVSEVCMHAKQRMYLLPPYTLLCNRVTLSEHTVCRLTEVHLHLWSAYTGCTYILIRTTYDPPLFSLLCCLSPQAIARVGPSPIVYMLYPISLPYICSLFRAISGGSMSTSLFCGQ